MFGSVSIGTASEFFAFFERDSLDFGILINTAKMNFVISSFSFLFKVIVLIKHFLINFFELLRRCENLWFICNQEFFFLSVLIIRSVIGLSLFVRIFCWCG